MCAATLATVCATFVGCEGGAARESAKRDAHAHVKKQTMAGSRLLSSCGHVVLARECKHTEVRNTRSYGGAEG